MMEKTYVFEAEYCDSTGYIFNRSEISVSGGTFDAAYAHAESIAHDMKEYDSDFFPYEVDYVEVLPKRIEVETSV